MYDNYSVLMSVYAKENPKYLRLAMNSMWRQTVPTNDFVLICDGRLTPDLDNVIQEMHSLYPTILNVIRLPENVGLGRALQIGVLECKNKFIARMDSDDIATFQRCEKELAIFDAFPEISIVGSIIGEFTCIADNSYFPKNIKTLRIVPEKSEDILSFAKKRNPFNHPSVMFKKRDVLAAGNYQDIRYIQDYYLWIKMLIAGFKGYNIQEPLVWMRVDTELFRRRSGKLYRDTQLNLFKYMKNQGFISNTRYVKSCILRACSSVAPNWLREFAFMKFLRKV